MRKLIGTAAVELAGLPLQLLVCAGIRFLKESATACSTPYPPSATPELTSSESSFAPFVTNLSSTFTTMGLIFLSGLGFPVWWEVLERVQDLVKENGPGKLRARLAHTKLVLTRQPSFFCSAGR